MSKVNLFKRACRAGLLCACMTGFVGQAHAANWLMLQGVENPKLPPQRLFAFVQPTFFHTQGEKLSGLTGPFAGNNGKLGTANTIAPKFNDGSRLDIQRARLGSRGRFTGAFGNSFTKKMNYFFLVEMAPNLLTYNQFDPNRARVVALDHASLTFNHIPGARIRVGLFKNPTSEELFQGIATFNYIGFTDFSARENLERFFKGANKPAGSPSSPSLGTVSQGVTAYGFSGVRDWGVQVFDSFKRGKWDLSYAVKVGRGEALSQPKDTDNNRELYLYASAEYNLPGGKGPYKNGVKLFGWHQSGKREFRSDTTGADYNRRRYGIGVSALGKFFGFSHKQRFGAELMFAEGMIFLGPTGGVANSGVAPLANGAVQIAADDSNKARAITLDYGYYLNRKWHFDVRYDRDEVLYDRASTVNAGNERTFTNWTLGATYNFTKKARMTFNYTFRNADAPNDYTTFTGGNAAVVTSNVRKIVDNIDDIYALQLTYIF